MRILLLLLIAAPLAAQDINLELRTKKNSYSFDKHIFPTGMKVADMDKKKMPFTLEKDLTLIYVFMEKNGGVGDSWANFLNLNKRYGKKDMDIITVQFENGLGFHQYHEKAKAFAARHPEVKKMYWDFFGYVAEDMPLSAFPSYFLVQDNTIIFTGMGEDPQVIGMLEAEIDKRVK